MADWTIKQLRQFGRALDTNHALEDYRDQHRLAAVLILLFPGNREPHIILTRRTQHLSNHAGQISFPGGSVDPEDPDPVHTALREAWEEIALVREGVEVLGVMEVTVLPSGFAVAPVLAVTDDVPLLKPNPAEVEEIFSIPLSKVTNLAGYGKDALVRDGQRREFWTLHYGDYTVWGATARMLRDLALLLHGSSGHE